MSGMFYGINENNAPIDLLGCPNSIYQNLAWPLIGNCLITHPQVWSILLPFGLKRDDTGGFILIPIVAIITLLLLVSPH